MLVSAVSQPSWDAAASQSILTDLFPTPLDWCFNDCMQKALRWGRKSGPEPVVVTFDSREESLKNWRPRAEGYERLYPHKVAGFAFSSMEKVLPLQAADMVAYEGFIFQCDRERRGGAEPTPRRNFGLLLEHLPLKGGFYTETQLLEYVAKVEAGAEWFDQNLCKLSSNSSARKAASARIAKIPEVLARHIARVYLPDASASVAASSAPLTTDLHWRSNALLPRH